MKIYLGLSFILVFGVISCADKNLELALQINTDATPVLLADEKFNESAISGSFQISDVNLDLIISGTIDTLLA